MSAQAISQLSMLPLLGNVRELENLLHRAVALGEGTELNLDEALHIASPSVVQVQTQNPVSAAMPVETKLPADLQNHLDAEEREILIRALRATGFNRTLAANLLGLSLRQIRYRIARLKIDAPSTRDDPDMT
jgi:two-component system response regulator PilR (NtrC family)